MEGCKPIFLLVLAAWMFQDVPLPERIRAQIDARHQEWRLARVTPEVEAEIRSRTPVWTPNMVLGDFDGNRQTDVAVLVEYPDAAVGGGRAVQLLAFLGDGKVFTIFVLENPAPHDPRQFLHTIREPGRNDAIGVEYEAVGGHEWIYRQGEWRSRPAP